MHSACFAQKKKTFFSDYHKIILSPSLNIEEPFTKITEKVGCNIKFVHSLVTFISKNCYFIFIQ